MTSYRDSVIAEIEAHLDAALGILGRRNEHETRAEAAGAFAAHVQMAKRRVTELEAELKSADRESAEDREALHAYETAS